MFGFFKSPEKKWNDAYDKLADGKITVQEFVDRNENRTLFYTTPIVTDKQGKECVNALHLNGSRYCYMPAFFSADDLKYHYESNGRVPNIIIKGDLKDVLSALDSTPITKDWGVVIEPDSSRAVGLPPNIRVTPKCLR